jgi:hypothetical protein
MKMKNDKSGFDRAMNLIKWSWFWYPLGGMFFSVIASWVLKVFHPVPTTPLYVGFFVWTLLAGAAFFRIVHSRVPKTQ